MNDAERREWVANDEGLYDLWKRSRKGIYAWVRENRQLIDEAVEPVIAGDKPAHHLTYGS
jgi:hypothetical protein